MTASAAVAATGPPGSGQPPGALSPPTDAFATVLNDEVARTAPAEGQQKAQSPKQAGRRTRDDDAKTARPTRAAAATSTGPVTVPATPLPTPATPPPTPATSAAEPSVPAPRSAPTLRATVSPAPQTTVPQTVAPAPAGPGTGPAALVVDSTANGGRTSDTKRDGSRDAPAARTAVPTTKAIVGHTVATHADRAAATTAAASSASDPVLGTAGTAATARSLPTTAAAGSPYGTRLQEATEAVRATIELAARQGVTQARIQLSPASLGGVQIHLQHTSDGLVARVIADHPEAAAALAQNGDELRRQLQSGGTTLLRLDIGSSDRRETGQQDGSGSAGSGTSTRGDAGAEDPTTSTVPATSDAVLTQLNLGANALVNVLA